MYIFDGYSVNFALYLKNKLIIMYLLFYHQKNVIYSNTIKRALLLAILLSFIKFDENRIHLAFLWSIKPYVLFNVYNFK